MDQASVVLDSQHSVSDCWSAIHAPAACVRELEPEVIGEPHSWLHPSSQLQHM